MVAFKEYQVIGRHLPTERDPNPKLYRMRIFSRNEVVAKSRFWYHLRQLRKGSPRGPTSLTLAVKKSTGEIVAVNEIKEKAPLRPQNYAIWLRYDSRSGTHNMYKEFRALSRAQAVEALYSDMSSKHRARARSIQVIRVAHIEKTADVKRPNIKQLLTPHLRFPLPHRVVKTRSLFLAKRPSTFY